MIRLEFSMKKPVTDAVAAFHSLEQMDEEFNAGYGIADIIGTRFNPIIYTSRLRNELNPVVERRSVEVLVALSGKTCLSLDQLKQRLPMSEIVIKSILRKLITQDMIYVLKNGYFINPDLRSPVEEIIAVETKVKRWQRALQQARRYSYFSDRVYVGLGRETIELVDRALLYHYRLGLLAVDDDGAEIVVEAPKVIPKQPTMHRYCAEYLFSLALDSNSNLERICKYEKYSQTIH